MGFVDDGGASDQRGQSLRAEALKEPGEVGVNRCLCNLYNLYKMHNGRNQHPAGQRHPPRLGTPASALPPAQAPAARWPCAPSMRNQIRRNPLKRPAPHNL